jgi:peptidoglycan/LPS O-acetylase OafA/YrhL
MGTLRTLLALSVLLAHTGVRGLVGARDAVQIFYMLSGFLISYVLVEARSYRNTRSFYINRYLRLYPIYLVVVVCTLVVKFGFLGRYPEFQQLYEQLPGIARGLLLISNATLFFQDWVMFAAVRHHVLVFPTAYYQSDVPIYEGLLIAPAWTLGVELSFYLVAPFVLARRHLVLLLLAGSVALRLWLIGIGVGLSDPWSYRFFPTELALFLIGALAHQELLPLYRRFAAPAQKYGACIGTASLIAVCLVYPYVPLSEAFKTSILYLLVVLLIPLAFIFQNRSRLDKWVGDLSYPIYIVHALVIGIITVLVPSVHRGAPRQFALICAGVAIVVAAALNLSVGYPIERLRARLRRPAVRRDSWRCPAEPTVQFR